MPRAGGVQAVVEVAAVQPEESMVVPAAGREVQDV